MIYLSCTECGVEARLPNGMQLLIESYNDLLDTLDECGTTQFQFSSSMDSPEEYTKDARTLALVEEIMERA